MSKVAVVEKPAYVISYENTETGDTFIHCDLKSPWTKSVRKSIGATFSLLMMMRRSPIYALSEGDEKHKKFLSLYGFTFMTPVECADGVTREIYKFTNGEEQWA